ncbi:MAG: nucleotide exchange factor GrpE [Deltaproteobacteria bacterium]|jgi:molecular chaperone GrpE|nr:nucleotide exchange factor GrpE [Deltaproteobacteria bacterium]
MDNGEYGAQTEEIVDQAEPGLANAAPAEELNPEEGETNWELEAQKNYDLYLRALAECENIRRRAQKDREEAYRYAASEVIKGLVPVMDNLRLALSYADESNPLVKALAEGVRMTLKGMLDFLAEKGLKEVEADRGQPFDPNIHEALGQEPDPELAERSISREVAKGYLLHDRLIRPAKVMVVKNQA